MKITREEIDAIGRAIWGDFWHEEFSYANMRSALEAAYRVRKERKKQKREKAIDFDEMLRVHAEWDKQVCEPLPEDTDT